VKWRTYCSFLIVLLGVATCSSLSLPARQSAGQKTASKKPGPTGKTRPINNRFDVYKYWIDEDAAYIITNAERAFFVQLTSDEERVQFIEQFWLRRDPTPDTIANEFREETYRRIAYSNENFGTRVPGWKTDRGRIYITWGAPDSRTKPPCPNPNRTLQEGAGFDDCFPYEIWHYNYIPWIGANVDLEFVDALGDGDFILLKEDSQKTAILDPNGIKAHEPGNDPIRGRIELYAGGFTPARTRFADLEALVTAGIVKNELLVNYHLDFQRLTKFTALTSLAADIRDPDFDGPAKKMTGPMHVNLYGRILSLGGRMVEEFEDAVPPAQSSDSLVSKDRSHFEYQRTLALRPGIYMLDIAAKEIETGKLGITHTRLAIPVFARDRLDGSSLILANHVDPSQDIAPPTFGAYRIQFAASPGFCMNEKAESFIQVYGLKLDGQLGIAIGSARYRITQNQKEIWNAAETLDSLRTHSEQVTLRHPIPLSMLQPGHYRFEVEVTDRIAHQTLLRAAEFDVETSADRVN
jgi:GWxTD domain-containing protein